VRVPEIAYRFSWPTDTSGPTFQVIARDFNVSTAAVTITHSLTGLAKDRVLVLTNASLYATPGATQAVVTLQLYAFTGAGMQHQVMRESPLQVADQIESMNWQGEIFIQGRGVSTNLWLIATFDAGVNANRLQAGFDGVVIPRGNTAAY